MNNSDRFSIGKRIKSFEFAFNGLKNLIIKEHNSRIHILALVCVIGSGIIFKISFSEWIAITIVAGLVFLSELFNTAIERLSDIVEPNRNIEIGLIKDYCAGAVLISAVISVIAGGLIFIPRFIEIIKTFTNP